MKIDTDIRHVTPPGANLFVELEFPIEEAERLMTVSQQEIKATIHLKEQLMGEQAAWSDEYGPDRWAPYLNTSS